MFIIVIIRLFYLLTLSLSFFVFPFLSLFLSIRPQTSTSIHQIPYLSLSLPPFASPSPLRTPSPSPSPPAPSPPPRNPDESYWTHRNLKRTSHDVTALIAEEVVRCLRWQRQLHPRDSAGGERAPMALTNSLMAGPRQSNNSGTVVLTDYGEGGGAAGVLVRRHRKREFHRDSLC